MEWISHIIASILLFFGVGTSSVVEPITPEATPITVEQSESVFSFDTMQIEPTKNSSQQEGAETALPPGKVAINFWRTYTKPSTEVLKTQLTDLQYKVTQEEGTERAGTSDLDKNYEPGIYVDILSGEPLFSSRDKYNSKTGWPSFTRPIIGSAVTEHTDFKLLSPRTEIRSGLADNHLGHVFTDGPKDSTGLRYCMNGAALRFVPLAEMKTNGYEQYIKYVE